MKKNVIDRMMPVNRKNAIGLKKAYNAITSTAFINKSTKPLFNFSIMLF